ncbi:MAG: hypothetical protein GC189_07260 [Alphaproteobacteria bacterium]|nr:hypothetical protein [Alphaproteobacteria bacterium]
MKQAWATLGGVAPNALCEARRRVHRRAQWLARFAHAYLPAQADDMHTALCWSDAPVSSLADEPEAAPHIALGETIPAHFTIVAPRLTVRYAPLLDQLWLGNPARPNNVFNLVGREETDLAEELPLAMRSLGAEALPLNVALPHADDLPPENSASPPVAETEELMRYYANAALLLEGVAPPTGAISAIRLWPHHFDMARTIALEGGRLLTLGLAPDDAFYDQPYLYVTVYPAAPSRALPAPPDGFAWRTEGFFGLAARASDLLRGANAAERAGAALNRAVALCADLPKAAD